MRERRAERLAGGGRGLACRKVMMMLVVEVGVTHTDRDYYEHHGHDRDHDAGNVFKCHEGDG